MDYEFGGEGHMFENEHYDKALQEVGMSERQSNTSIL